ncbi:hypothetical protein BGZ63DRAFT_462817 [Mariannaea sp. PMI_226]|nr:hypothetical protein BGZ63DRAFT_462817 [Mariannaea sp. PMI_226]
MEAAVLALAVSGVGVKATKAIREFKDAQRDLEHSGPKIESLRSLAKVVHREIKDIIKAEKNCDFPLLPKLLPEQAYRLIKCIENETRAIDRFHYKYKKSLRYRFVVWVNKSSGKDPRGEHDKIVDDLGRWLSIVLSVASLYAKFSLTGLGPQGSPAQEAKLLLELRTAKQKQELSSHRCTRKALDKHRVDTGELIFYARNVLEYGDALLEIGIGENSVLGGRSLSPLPGWTQRNDNGRLQGPRSPGQTRQNGDSGQRMPRHSSHGKGASRVGDWREDHPISTQEQTWHSGADPVHMFGALQTFELPNEEPPTMQHPIQVPNIPLGSQALEPEPRDEPPATFSAFSATTHSQQGIQHQTQQQTPTKPTLRRRPQFSAPEVKGGDSGSRGYPRPAPQPASTKPDSNSRNPNGRGQSLRKSSRHGRDSDFPGRGIQAEGGARNMTEMQIMRVTPERDIQAVEGARIIRKSQAVRLVPGQSIRAEDGAQNMREIQVIGAIPERGTQAEEGPQTMKEKKVLRATPQQGIQALEEDRAERPQHIEISLAKSLLGIQADHATTPPEGPLLVYLIHQQQVMRSQTITTHLSVDKTDIPMVNEGNQVEVGNPQPVLTPGSTVGRELGLKAKPLWIVSLDETGRGVCDHQQRRKVPSSSSNCKGILWC